MKLTDAEKTMLAYPSFSILERIELGETAGYAGATVTRQQAFSILERIELGETTAESLTRLMPRPFSILERIELGETSSR